jgi:peptidoglycan/LPS O-acetylase OafA/YrhL
MWKWSLPSLLARRPGGGRDGSDAPRAAFRGAFRPDIEGLRAVAVVLVIAFHAGVSRVSGGYVGVDVFFVISGFLITGLLIDELERTGSISFGTFYARRARRLLPMAAFVLVAVAVGMEFFTAPVMRPSVRLDALSAAFYYSNWQFALESVNYLTLGAGQNPVLHYWSLSVEEQFYLLWPGLLVLAMRFPVWRRRSPSTVRRVAATVGVVGVVSFIYSISATAANPAVAYFETTTRIWEFAAGAALALSTRRLQFVPRTVAALAGVIGLVLLAAAAYVNGLTTPFPGVAALLPVAGALLVIAAGVAAPTWGAGAVLSLRPLRFLGRISYPWYLWHWPCLVFARTARWAPADGRIGWLAISAAIAISFALAVITHALIEVPARRAQWIAVSRKRVVVLAGSATAAAVLALGIAGGPLVVPGATFDFIGSANAQATVPGAATPLAAQASTAYGELHGCHVGYGATRPEQGCAFGDLKSTRTVVLIGDSHAAQWFPALERLAQRERFRLVSWTKSGCPFAPGVHIFLPAIGRDYTECNAWQAGVLRTLRTLPRPVLIIVARTSTYLPQVLASDGDQTTPAQARRLWGRAVASGMRQLERFTPRVILLRDTPRPPSNIPACISWDPGEPAACNFRRPRDGHSDDAEYTAERAAGTPAALYATTTTVVCPHAVCPAVVDGIIVFRDDNHLTAAFAALRWRQLADALARANVKRPI